KTMTNVATVELEINTEAELFDVLARYGISQATFAFSYDGHGFHDSEDLEFDYNDDEIEIPDEVDEAIREAVESFATARADALRDGADGDGFSGWEKYGNVGEKFFMGACDDDVYPTVTFDVAARKVSLDGKIVVKEITAETVSKTWNPDEE